MLEKIVRCHFCDFSGNLLKVVNHQRIHTHIKNIDLYCPIENCRRKFKLYSSFKNHVHKFHITKSINASVSKIPGKFCCSIDFCKESFGLMKELSCHLKGHIREGIKIECPIDNCSAHFTVKSSFSSHLSRKHYNWADYKSDAIQVPQIEEKKQEVDEPPVDVDVSDGVNTNTKVETDVVNYIKMVSVFLLKMQVKHHISHSAIQDIVTSFRDFHCYEKDHFLSYFHQQMSNLALDMEIRNKIMTFCNKDIFKIGNDPENGLLRSRHTREKYIKQNTNYVAPIEINLGRNAMREKQSMHYIPLKKSLTALFTNRSVREQFNKKKTLSDSYDDIHDGTCYKNNELFSLETGIELIIYQDAFEVNNVLGAAKGKDKLVGVYYTLGNFLPSNRSKVDPIQLIILSKEKHLKQCSLEKFFQPLVSELTELYEEGFDLGYPDKIRGSLVAILGDNLGSHAIGGFCENFVADFFCRYCLVKRKDFLRGNNCAVARSVENYNIAATKAESDKSTFQGIKFHSPLNKVPSYHVCNPGLPPCLAHDLFEGIVRYDIFKFINHMCKKLKWLTYCEMNSALSNFRYKSYDSLDKPPVINFKSEKVSGHAVQNWTLIRNLPLIMKDYLKDPSDPVWQLVLLLKNIVAHICAPSITSDQICYLEGLVEEYIEHLSSLGVSNLRPKHHFLLHYGELIRQFGPLSKMSTLRMESKHQFFKRSVNESRNRKNHVKSAAIKHQLLQAYLLEGPLFPPQVVFDKAECLNTNLSDNLKQDLTHCSEFTFDDHSLISNEASVFNCNYKAGSLLVLSHRPGYMLLGEVKSILMNKSKIFFHVALCDGVLDGNLDCYEVIQLNQSRCVGYDELADRTPLPCYNCQGTKHVTLKYILKQVDY